MVDLRNGPSEAGWASTDRPFTPPAIAFQREPDATRRTLQWDGANRLQALSEQGRTTRYAYDANGERVLKERPKGRRATINRYYSVRNGAIATKHVFAGNNRVASVVHPGGPNEVASATRGGGLFSGFFSDGKPGNDRARDALQNPAFGGRTPGGFEGGHPGQGTDNRSEAGDDNSSNVEQNPHLGGSAGGSGSGARFLYYLHTDHLGSTNYVTDPSGELYQHLQYFPFGELWADQRTERHRLRHLFTGKELDEETGLYYFGARYYDPRTSVWASADPAIENYLPGRRDAGKSFREMKASLGGIGGVYNSYNLGQFGYSFQNPVVLKDPDGKEVSVTHHELYSTGDHHLSVRITPKNQQKYANDPRFQNKDKSGERYATISAGPGGTLGQQLVSDVNRSSDLGEQDGKVTFQPPSGMSEDEYIKLLFSLDEKYGDNLDYDLYPEQEEDRSYFWPDDSYNSNSYVSGLLQASGLEDVPNPTDDMENAETPGFNRPVPKENFQDNKKE